MAKVRLGVRPSKIIFENISKKNFIIRSGREFSTFRKEDGKELSKERKGRADEVTDNFQPKRALKQSSVTVPDHNLKRSSLIPGQRLNNMLSETSKENWQETSFMQEEAFSGTVKWSAEQSEVTSHLFKFPRRKSLVPGRRLLQMLPKDYMKDNNFAEEKRETYLPSEKDPE